MLGGRGYTGADFRSAKLYTLIFSKDVLILKCRCTGDLVVQSLFHADVKHKFGAGEFKYVFQKHV